MLDLKNSSSKTKYKYSQIDSPLLSRRQYENIDQQSYNQESQKESRKQVQTDWYQNSHFFWKLNTASVSQNMSEFTIKHVLATSIQHKIFIRVVYLI